MLQNVAPLGTIFRKECRAGQGRAGQGRAGQGRPGQGTGQGAPTHPRTPPGTGHRGGRDSHGGPGLPNLKGHRLPRLEV